MNIILFFKGKLQPEKEIVHVLFVFSMEIKTYSLNYWFNGNLPHNLLPWPFPDILFPWTSLCLLNARPTSCSAKNKWAWKVMPPKCNHHHRSSEAMRSVWLFFLLGSFKHKIIPENAHAIQQQKYVAHIGLHGILCDYIANTGFIMVILSNQPPQYWSHGLLLEYMMLSMFVSSMSYAHIIFFLIKNNISVYWWTCESHAVLMDEFHYQSKEFF